MKIEVTKQISEQVELDIEFPLYLSWCWIGEYPGTGRDKFMRINEDGSYWDITINDPDGDGEHAITHGKMELQSELHYYLDFLLEPKERAYTWKRATAACFYSALDKICKAAADVPPQ